MYESYFTFKEKPFSLLTNTKYLFLSEQHEEAFTHLLYSLEQGGAFTLLTGEVGTGKTILCNKFIDYLRDKGERYIVLNSIINHDEVYATVIQTHLGVKVSCEISSSKLLSIFRNKLLQANYEKQKSIFIIIDEAQALSQKTLEKLRLLTNIELRDRHFFHVILIGQPELLDAVSNNALRQLAQRISANYQLKALSLSETKTYIAHRLKIAEATENVFDEKSQKELYIHSKGIPRVINLLADYALLEAYATGRRNVTSLEVKNAAQQVFFSKISPSFGHRLRYFLKGKRLLVALALFFVILFLVYGLLYVSSTINDPLPLFQEQQINKSSLRIKAKNKKNKQALGEVQKIDHNFLNKIAYTNGAENILLGLQLISETWKENSQFGVLNEKQFCIYMETKSLQCLQHSTWEDVIKVNRPALVELQLGEQKVIMILLSFHEGYAEVSIYGHRLSIKTKYLFSSPIKRGFSLWRPIAQQKRLYTLGDESQDISVLKDHVFHAYSVLIKNNDKLLALRNMLYTSTPKTFFNKVLKDIVMDLQQTANLKVDGVVGVQTQLFINDVLYQEEIPQLKPITYAP